MVDFDFQQFIQLLDNIICIIYIVVEGRVWFDFIILGKLLLRATSNLTQSHSQCIQRR